MSKILKVEIIDVVHSYPKTVIFRHKKERLKKCSLHGLESRGDIEFYPYPLVSQPSLSNYIVLTIEAKELSEEDDAHGLLLLDATWRYAGQMLETVQKQPGLIYRSLPGHFRTAYPRKQTGCSDPKRGLASVEALYAAYHLLGRDTAGLLDHYYWKETFLKLNFVDNQ